MFKSGTKTLDAQMVSKIMPMVNLTKQMYLGVEERKANVVEGGAKHDALVAVSHLQATPLAFTSSPSGTQRVTHAVKQQNMRACTREHTRI
jgi:hypothetical protein